MSDQLPALVAQDVVVSLDYTLTVDGELIESSMESGPLEYLHGHNNLIPGLENALTGMSAGDFKEVHVKAVDAYGEVDQDAFVEMDRSHFPPNFPVEVGRQLRVRTGDGHLMNASIASFTDSSVRLDLNHPLAGKNLDFTARIVGLRAASELELQSGRIGGGCSSCGSDGCSTDGCGSGGCSSCG